MYWYKKSMSLCITAVYISFSYLTRCIVINVMFIFPENNLFCNVGPHVRDISLEHKKQYRQ